MTIYIYGLNKKPSGWRKIPAFAYIPQDANVISGELVSKELCDERTKAASEGTTIFFLFYSAIDGLGLRCVRSTLARVTIYRLAVASPARYMVFASSPPGFHLVPKGAQWVLKGCSKVA